VALKRSKSPSEGRRHKKERSSGSPWTGTDGIVLGLAAYGAHVLWMSRQQIAGAMVGGGEEGDKLSPLECGLLVSATLSYGFQLVNFGLSRCPGPRGRLSALSIFHRKCKIRLIKSAHLRHF
jgi:hypothetical protein